MQNDESRFTAVHWKISPPKQRVIDCSCVLLQHGHISSSFQIVSRLVVTARNARRSVLPLSRLTFKKRHFSQCPYVIWELFSLRWCCSSLCKRMSLWLSAVFWTAITLYSVWRNSRGTCQPVDSVSRLDPPLRLVGKHEQQSGLQWLPGQQKVYTAVTAGSRP